MKTLFAAIALTIAAPAFAQADPHAGHDMSGHKEAGHEGHECCKQKDADGSMKDCCKAMADGKMPACCEKQAGHDGHAAKN